MWLHVCTGNQTGCGRFGRAANRGVPDQDRFLIAGAGRFHQQKFPSVLDGALRRRLERFHLELAAAEGKQPEESLLPDQRSHRRVGDDAGLDVNLPAQLPVANFQDGRAASDAFHLDDILHADLPQRATETVTIRPRHQVVQQVENHLDAVGGNRFLDKQFGAVGQTGRAIAFRGAAGHDGEFETGITLVDDSEQLQDVHHRYPDVQHDEINRTLLQNGQGPVGGRRGMNFPRVVGEDRTQFAEGFKEGHAVVHEKDMMLFRGVTVGVGLGGRNRFLGRERGHRRRGKPGRFGFGRRDRGKIQCQCHVAEAQRLSRLQHRLGNFPALDERAVGGKQIAHDQFIALQPDFTMPARNGRFDDLKRVPIRAPDRDPVPAQFVGQAGQCR